MGMTAAVHVPAAPVAAAATSPPLTVRRLLVDLDTPVPRHWCDGDPFRTALFNALSMSFPAGEQLFIDSIRKAMPELPAEQQERFADEVQGFIGQEATHRRIHQRFNALLEQQGLRNVWEGTIQSRRPMVEGIDVRNWIAGTAATEHLTAVFSEYLLAHPQVFGSAGNTEPRLRDLWLWHCAEEAEHRSTAFDIYMALGGNHEWRLRVFKMVAWLFVRDVISQTLRNLWRGGGWWWPSTWANAWRWTFGRQGLVRWSWARWREYLREDFHPSQGDAAAALRWLAAHGDIAPAVRAAA
jgi:uncharacterized protein